MSRGVQSRSPVNISDAAGELLRLAEHYRQMCDDELLILARQKPELTDLAQQALTQEISRRALNITENTPVKVQPQRPLSREYEEDQQLVEIATVWSISDALQLQWLLDRAGIPFFMGEEKATGVDKVTSHFDQGVSVQVMNIAIPWVRDVMKVYEPRDDREPKEPELRPAPIRCPKCHSEEVVFESMVPEAEGQKAVSKFQWTCDMCGHQWVDDGIGKSE